MTIISGIGIQIGFTNYSDTSFDLSSVGTDIHPYVDNLTKYPSNLLQASSGQEYIAAEQSMLGPIASGGKILWCCWRSQTAIRATPNPTVTFGVKIIYGLQVFEVGWGPYWHVMDTFTEGGPVWTRDGVDPATPYTWPNTPGVTIVARPTAGHTTLDVEVTIDNVS